MTAIAILARRLYLLISIRMRGSIFVAVTKSRANTSKFCKLGEGYSGSSSILYGSRKRVSGYGPNVWGISASDTIKGYVAWGGPPRDPAIDGTVVPYAAAGSLMFVPQLAIAALQTM